MSNIITPTNKPTPLSIETATQIAGAIARLQEIGHSTIIDPKSEAEQKGLQQFLANTLPQHSNELIACWFAVKTEYEPLIQGVQGLLRRATAAQPKQPEQPKGL